MTVKRSNVSIFFSFSTPENQIEFELPTSINTIVSHNIVTSSRISIWTPAQKSKPTILLCWSFRTDVKYIRKLTHASPSTVPGPPTAHSAHLYSHTRIPTCICSCYLFLYTNYTVAGSYIILLFIYYRLFLESKTAIGIRTCYFVDVFKTYDGNY